MIFLGLAGLRSPQARPPPGSYAAELVADSIIAIGSYIFFCFSRLALSHHHCLDLKGYSAPSMPRLISIAFTCDLGMLHYMFHSQLPTVAHRLERLGSH
jgi:hypothetical protein